MTKFDRAMASLAVWAAALMSSLGSNLAASYGGGADCWDQDRLNQMKTNLNPDQASDPNLAQFFNLVKCLQGQQGSSGSIDQNQWNNFQNNPMQGGNNNLFNMWNNRRNNPNQPPQWQRPNNMNNNPYPNQPMPGVHPDDHNSRQPWNYNNRNSNFQPQPGWPQQPPPPPQQPHLPPSRGGGPEDHPDGDRDSGNRGDRKNRRKNRRRKQDQLQPDQPVTPPIPGSPGSDWNKNRQQLPPSSPTDQYSNNGMTVGTDTDQMMMNSPERTEISLKRQYGYAIMALSVVVLAVLTVITIFCCNSSNSGSSGAATQGAGAPGLHGGSGAGDNFSIYSYKQELGVGPGGVGSDTMRSTAIDSHLGVVGTHTLQSRASPQYRVSDIDPEYARRYHREADNHHY